MPPKFSRFRFWCQSVLPLVYDDSLSYYEVLCKVVKYLNDMTEAVNEVPEELDELKKELDVINQWIENFDTDYLEQIIRESLIKMIFVEINDAGYFVYYIPEGWEEITFETTGWDVNLELMPDYGHLVLSY